MAAVKVSTPNAPILFRKAVFVEDEEYSHWYLHFRNSVTGRVYKTWASVDSTSDCIAEGIKIAQSA